MTVVCHPATRKEEEEATLDTTCTIVQVPPVGSLVTTAAVVGAKGVLEESPRAFSGSTQSCEAFCGYEEVGEFVAVVVRQDGHLAEIELRPYLCEQLFLPQVLRLCHQMN